MQPAIVQRRFGESNLQGEGIDSNGVVHLVD